MEPGLVVAHIVMLLMAPLLAAFVGYSICHGREHQYARRIRREAPAYARALPKQDLSHQ